MQTQYFSSMIRLGLTGMLACVVLAGCSWSLPKLKVPRVHKISVQQGNVITQDMVDRLKPGMSRSQVAYVMGEPVLRNTFDDSRWEYIYTLDVPNVLKQEIRMTLFFEGDSLAYFTGDMAPSQAIEDNEEEPATAAGNSDQPSPAAATPSA
ncbi:MAG: outer membrane protein assembly factor BamE [Pseudomonadota bacterium]